MHLKLLFAQHVLGIAPKRCSARVAGNNERRRTTRDRKWCRAAWLGREAWPLPFIQTS
jgi:hypothetical protein